MKHISCLLLLFYFSTSYSSLPKFSSRYEATGVLSLPYAELNEPFHIWYSEEGNICRTDYYNGVDKTIIRGNETQYGTSYSITYMNGKQKCFKVPGDDGSAYAIQSFIPDLSNFSYVGSDVKDNKEIIQYQRIVQHKEKVNTYNFYYYVENGINIPSKFSFLGYDIIIGSHYDQYEFKFDTFTTVFDDSVFNVADSYTCGPYPKPTKFPGETHIIHSPYNDLLGLGVIDRAHGVFEEFKNFFGKSYRTLIHKLEARKWFTSNLRFIHSKNRAGLKYKLKINHFADQSLKNIKRSLLNKAQPDFGSNSHALPFDTSKFDSTIPSTWDWRLYGAVTPVKDQATCGSCWSFSTTGAIEGQHFLKTGMLTDFSQQNLMDCSWDYGNYGCDGGWQWYSFQYIIDQGGLMTENEYGHYLGQNGICHYRDSPSNVKITHYVNVTENDENALQIAIANVGPISVNFDVTDDFLFYSHGVFDDSKCGNKQSDLNHCILAVGYGEMEGEPYWLVKNSWSTHWGNDGYFLITRNNNNCGIATSPSYPILA